jgi:1-aminocyclopropane-1-carboxylate deaminase/D-cysteine desulfhydrase-like pyridoxal-dependent ACC family enzyme
VLQLGTYPTPVERIDTLSLLESSLWVKRDDRTSSVYGGNKVRKLERLLDDARTRGARRIVTVGAAGSHHVLATGIFARELGLPVEAVLVPQPRTPHVAENLRADLALDVRIFPAPTFAHAALRLLGRIARGAYYIPVGGSSLLGALAYVDAARELASQVRGGVLPEPDVVVVALGSGGTAGGLAAGLALEGMKTRLVAVTVADPAAWVARRAHVLARAAIRYEGRRLELRACPAIQMEVDRRYLGAGYGQGTEAAHRAMRLASASGLALDLTYTGKTFAAALDLVHRRSYRNVLFWHTLSSAPMNAWLARAPAESDLSRSIRSLLQS